MSDRLRQIKDHYIRQTMDADTGWLIAEVERLRSHQGWDTENMKLQREIESLTKERDEFENKLADSKANCQLVAGLNKKLEAENAELKVNMDGFTRLDLSANWTVDELKPEIERLERELAASEKARKKAEDYNAAQWGLMKK